MGSRSLKKTIMAILVRPDLEGILREFGEWPAQDAVNVLFSAICHTDELIHWHGVSAMGVTVARLAVEDMEKSRVVMRRFLWSLNDESGGIGWGAPEAMAEAMVHHKGLAVEYLHMLISYMRGDGEELLQQGNFLEHEGLQRGLLWGIGRLAVHRGEMLLERDVVPDIEAYLNNSRDMVVRGLAARALGLLGTTSAVDAIRALAAENVSLRLYDHGTFMNVTVGELAKRALMRLGTRDGDNRDA